jgi:hypothetical protein
MCFFAPYLFSFGCTLPSEGIPREDKTSEKEKSAGKDSGKDKDGVSLPPIASGSTASTPAASGEGESEQAGACTPPPNRFAKLTNPTRLLGKKPTNSSNSDCFHVAFVRGSPSTVSVTHILVGGASPCLYHILSVPKPGAKPSTDDSGTASASSLPSLPGAGPARPPVHRGVADVVAASKNTRKLSPLVTKEGGGGGPPAKLGAPTPRAPPATGPEGVPAPSVGPRRIPTLQTVRSHGFFHMLCDPPTTASQGGMEPLTEV